VKDKGNSDKKKKYIIDINKLKKKSLYPSPERFNKGPVVVVECDQEIPCNPCETVCPKKVITVGDPITNTPKINDIDSCTGCGLCVITCPGLAIFIIDKTYSKEKALVTIPYEILPLPKQRDEILAMDREGKFLCRGTVNKVKGSKNFDHTSLVTIEVPKEFADNVRYFKKETNDE
jgi:Fe-S-cluster-containing hydrogenase component 2